MTGDRNGAEPPPTDGLRPWPPEERTPVLDVVAAFYECDDYGELPTLFAPDVVFTPPPTLAMGDFRPYFGLEGMGRWLMATEAQWPGIRPVPDRYLADGNHAVVLGRLVMPERELPVAWLWTVRGGRVRALRGFRYASEALSRLSALASEDGAG